ncbi:MAG: DUF4443 domain-containing protein [Candidatus Micrarchaeia archaeon]|jgi:hypothetical protein
MLGFLEKFEREKSALPVRFFSVDLLRALWLLRAGRISRSALARGLGIGEGSVRTIISFLLVEGVVEISREGVALSKKGAAVVGEFEGTACGSHFSERALSFGKPGFLVRIRDLGKPRDNGQAARDLAVRMGADGATIFFAQGGKLLLPFDSAGNKNFFGEKTVESVCRACGSMEDGDVFMLAFGSDACGVQRGAWSVAATLMKPR